MQPLFFSFCVLAINLCYGSKETGLASSSPMSPSPYQCPDGWSNFANFKCFKVPIKASRFHESSSYCQTLAADATLASVHSSDENSFLVSLAFNDANNDRQNDGSGIWLGGEQIATGLASYKWMDGTAFLYQNWSTRSVLEPNCRTRNGCCAVSLDYRGDWFDISCNHASRFACQTYLRTPDDRLFEPDNYLMRFELLVHRELLKLRDNMTDLYLKYQTHHQQSLQADSGALQTTSLLSHRCVSLITSLLVSALYLQL